MAPIKVLLWDPGPFWLTRKIGQSVRFKVWASLAPFFWWALKCRALVLMYGFYIFTDSRLGPRGYRLPKKAH